MYGSDDERAGFEFELRIADFAGLLTTVADTAVDGSDGCMSSDSHRLSCALAGSPRFLSVGIGVSPSVGLGGAFRGFIGSESPLSRRRRRVLETLLLRLCLDLDLDRLFFFILCTFESEEDVFADDEDLTVAATDAPELETTEAVSEMDDDAMAADDLLRLVRSRDARELNEAREASSSSLLNNGAALSSEDPDALLLLRELRPVLEVEVGDAVK